nr:reverse transcriptase domain-containing protein [Tanacetum cinerariifolium]
MKRRPEEGYDHIENMTAHLNDWDTLAERSESSSSITSFFDTEIAALKAEMAEINKNLMRVLQVNQQNKAVTPNCETFGGPHSFSDCPATVGQTQNVYAVGAYQGNIITNPKEELKGITTRSGTAYQGPTILTTSSSLPSVVERETDATKDTVHPTNNRSIEDVQPPTESPILNSDPVIVPIIEPVASPVTLADLGASINLMPLSVWNNLSLPDMSLTCMTLELADRSISRLVGVAKDVYVKVGTFHFPSDFVVVDFDADTQVPLILGRSFLKTERALIDVFKANQIDVIDMACEEYTQAVLNFSDVIASGNPTPYYNPIVSTTSPTLTPFGNSDFLLEEVDAFLALEDDPTSTEVDQSYVDTEGDILLLKAFLNDDPSLPPPNQGNYLPQVRKELKICEAKTDKSSIDEPPEVKLKDLPPHLEYTFMEGDDKLPVIIAKDLSVEEKTALITEDFEPAVQHQRRVNPKIHDVIKNEVLKLLDAGLIYPISDSPWVSPVHCVPKKGGFTVVENEKNELISTRLITGWRVYIDYHKLNEATRKDHFPLPFMDQMLERLAGNENSFQTSLSHLKKMLKMCEHTNLCLNWEKSHFMVKEGIVLSHKISKNGIEVDKDKVNVIAKLPYPTIVKGIRSFLGHASFYRRFIKDFSKIAWPMTRLLEKDTSFFISKECVEAFQTVKRKLTEAPILITPE